MGGNGNGPLEEAQMGVGDGKGTVVGDVDVVDIQDTSMEGLVESLFGTCSLQPCPCVVFWEVEPAYLRARPFSWAGCQSYWKA